MALKPPRIDWLDRFKGMAMIFVMVGHMDMFLGLTKWIYTFHVPLFFFASGYLFDASKFPGVGRWAGSRVRSLGLPYMVFGAIGIVGFLVGAYLGVVRNPHYTSLGSFIGLLFGIRDTSPFNGALWFVSCLATVEVLRVLVRRACFSSSKRQLLAVGLIGTVGVLMLGHWPWRLVFGFDIALVCLAFHYAGGVYRQLPDRAIGLLESWPAFLCLGAGSVLASWFLAEPNLYHARIGNPVYFHAIALLGILFVLNLSKRLPSIPVLSHIGANSLVYLALHQWLVFSVVSRVLDHAGLAPTDLVNQLARSAALLGVSIATIGPLSVFLERYLPETVGKKRRVLVNGG